MAYELKISEGGMPARSLVTFFVKLTSYFAVVLSPALHGESVPHFHYSASLSCEADLTAQHKKSLAKALLEVNAEVVRARGQWPAGVWEERVILKNEYVKNHLLHLQAELQDGIERERRQPLPRLNLIDSAEVTNQYLNSILKYYVSNGISYLGFLKISLLYAVQIDLLLPARNTTMLNVRPFEEGRLDLIMKKRANVESFLAQEHYEFMIADPEYSDGLYDEIDFRQFESARNSIIGVPTFADVGFRFILWAASRKIGILGQRTKIEIVDGGQKSPLRFFIHDGSHDGDLARAEQDQDFWDKLESRVEHSHSENLKIVKYGVLFLLFHELGKDMSCAGVHDWRRGNDPNFMSSSYRRMSNPRDLGAAMEGVIVTRELLGDAIFEVLDDLTAICG